MLQSHNRSLEFSNPTNHYPLQIHVSLLGKKNLCSLVISTDALIRSAGFIQEQDLSLEETQKDLRKQFLTSNNVAQGVSTIFIQAIYHLG